MKYALVVLIIAALMALPLTSHAIAATNAEILSLNCNGCHGQEGISSGLSIPSIAGLNFRYFMRTMLRFKKGERESTIMDRIARGYTILELRKISKYFSALEWGNTTADLNGDKVRRGSIIHDELCVECHANNGEHQDKDIPRISGQTTYYLYLQMLDYRAGRQTMPQPDKMKEQLEMLTTGDLEALSHFYGSGI